MATPGGPGWLAAVPEASGLWLEVTGVPEPRRTADTLLPVLSALHVSQRAALQIHDELADRLEEIDLLYTISETLGRTLRLDEAARTIIREVASVFSARRGSIMVYDEAAATLQTVAVHGFRGGPPSPVRPDDPHSIAARAWREQRVLVFDPADPRPEVRESAPERGYRGRAFISVPITYAAPGTAPRCVGVINLTDRLGPDAFTRANVRLLTAIANQVGAAVENARLVERDLERRRLEHELDLAHQLQMRLLPSPAVLEGLAQVDARFQPAESVGGDFYSFTRLPGGRVGVMVGDVSSHGFSAALMMALVMSAAGIHAGTFHAPDDALRQLLRSLADDLASTEMHFSIFYGIIDPGAHQLHYASAGHQHAFRLSASGAPYRLATTAPPLGLAEAATIGRRTVMWTPGADLLCLWTDGLVDARNEAQQPFGEARLLELLSARTGAPVPAIVAEVFGAAEAFCPEPEDDRTLLIVRV